MGTGAGFLSRKLCGKSRIFVIRLVEEEMMEIANSCVSGTMSYQQTEAHRCVDDMHTVENYCVDALRRYPDGTVDGETILVYTDCMTRLPLPMDQQTIIYRLPGVALDQGEHPSAQDLGGYPSDSEQQVL